MELGCGILNIQFCIYAELYIFAFVYLESLTMRNKIGAPVDGEDFFGREREISYVWALLRDGNNVLLPSPRRVGKSSFAKKMLETARLNEWESVEMNLEQVHSEFDFITLLAERLRQLSRAEQAKEVGKQLLDLLGSLKPKISVGGASLSVEWQREKSNVYRELEKMLPHEKETLIFFDEVAVLLNSILNSNNGDKKQVEEFLHWLRSLRQISGSKIRWIFSSSVGIENFTSGHQLGKTINDFTRYELKPFTPESAKAMIVALENGTGIGLNDEVREKMLSKLGYLLPYFIQILFQNMRARVSVEGALMNADLVENSYGSITDGDYLNTWVERLQEQYNDYEADAFLVLKHTCQSNGGVKRENLTSVLHQKYGDIDRAENGLATVLHMLNNDGYLTEENGLHLFRSPLIRDFWHNRFVR